MRRSTAAAIGTLAGAAMIVGVRMSVEVPDAVAAPPAVDLSGGEQSAPPAEKAPADEEDAPEDEGNADDGDAEADAGDAGDADADADAAPDEEDQAGGLQDGIFEGSAEKNPYGTIQVSIKISNGRITAADASYPTAGDSSRINPPAVDSLNQSTLAAQSADVDAVSGATFTSDGYAKSLQAALDQAGG